MSSSSCSSGWPWAQLPYSHPTKMPASLMLEGLAKNTSSAGHGASWHIRPQEVLVEANGSSGKPICRSWQETRGEDP